MMGKRTKITAGNKNRKRKRWRKILKRNGRQPLRRWPPLQTIVIMNWHFFNPSG